MRAAISEHLDARELLKLLRAVKDGDFSKRIPIGESGVESDIALALNEIIAMNEAMATELQRIGHVVGKEGKLSERAMLVDARGSWASSIDAINGLIDDLGQPTNEMARVIGAVAEGNLTQTMPMEIEGRPVKGAFLSIARTVNTMVDQLNAFASEVTRVAREVGTEGKLGGQADVKGVAGVWKGLTDNVLLMAPPMSMELRIGADAAGDVAQSEPMQNEGGAVKGAFLSMASTVNTMVDQLKAFASEVTRV